MTSSHFARLLHASSVPLRWGRHLPAFCLECLRRERDRWSLWLAPAFGCGAALFFAWPTEPPVWAAAGLFLVVVAGLPLSWRTVLPLSWRTVLPLSWRTVLPLSWRTVLPLSWRTGRSGWPLVALLAAVLGGFAAGTVRARVVAAPVLPVPTATVRIVGTVEEAAPGAGKGRVRIAVEAIERMRGPIPERIRLSVRTLDDWPLGAKLRILAHVSPPSGPVVPGGYDFARALWFSRIGAVGFALGRPEILSEPPSSVWVGVERLRLYASIRFRALMGDESGAVAAALATGFRNAVPEDLAEAYRNAGLAHMLSISGLHFSLVAGLIFVGMRSFLALVPVLALRWDVKKGAAACSLLLSGAYLVFSGGHIPALRAFLMGAVFLGAVLLDRAALTMRSVAFAAVAILVLHPESIVSPSFQMSFAAVVALIATYESVSPILSRRQTTGGMGAVFLRRGGSYLAGVLLSALVAGLATMPYAAFHFQRISVYGLVANLLAMPILSFWVMPWLLAALALMPFGGESAAAPFARMGLEAIESIARAVSAWPQAAVPVGAVPASVLVLFTVGGLWLCLWRRPWRWGGLPVLLFAVFRLWIGQTPPDVVVAADASLFAVRSGPGIVLSPGRSNAFARRVWTERFGAGEGRWTWGGLAAGEEGVVLRCDRLGCLYRRGGRQIALVWDDAALAEDCRDSDVVVAAIPTAGRRCAAVLVGAERLRAQGPASVTLTEKGVLTDWAAARRGVRLWSVRQRRQ